MKLSVNQRKLLIRLLERYEAKINKPRAERWVDAQYEAHFIFSSVTSNWVGDRMNKTPEKQVQELHAITEELRLLRQAMQLPRAPAPKDVGYD